MKTLGKIFGSEGRVRIMRLFLFNSGRNFDLALVAKRSNVDKSFARREVDALEEIHLLTKKFLQKPNKEFIGKKKKNRSAGKKRKLLCWTLNPRFSYLNELQSLLVNTTLFSEDEIVRRLAGTGKIRLIIMAGVFIQNSDSRVDLFIIGDKINKKKLTSAIRRMESEIGRELQYACLDTQDFKYRMSIYDKLVRDVLDYPHKVALDRVGVKLGFD